MMKQEVVPETVAMYDSLIFTAQMRLDYWTDRFHNATDFRTNEQRIAAREHMSWWYDYQKEVQVERDQYVDSGTVGRLGAVGTAL